MRTPDDFYTSSDGQRKPVSTVRTTGSGKQNPLITHILDTDGDKTGTIEAIGDYSVTPEIFYLQPPAGEVWQLTRLLFFVQDSGSFDADNWGNNITLTNGIILRIQDDSGTIFDFTQQVPIVSSGHLGVYMFDVEVFTWGSGDEILAARYTFAKSGANIRLIGDNNERFEVLLNDDFTGLVSQHFMVQGFKEVGTY